MNPFIFFLCEPQDILLPLSLLHYNPHIQFKTKVGFMSYLCFVLNLWFGSNLGRNMNTAVTNLWLPYLCFVLNLGRITNLRQNKYHMNPTYISFQRIAIMHARRDRFSTHARSISFYNLHTTNVRTFVHKLFRRFCLAHLLMNIRAHVAGRSPAAAQFNFGYRSKQTSRYLFSFYFERGVK